MPNIPSVTGNEVLKAFAKLGFVEVRVSGSHHILKKAGHEHLLSIPVHSGKCVKTGLLVGAIKDSGHTVEQFIKVL
jgi:predicted RNA binding protein YcfA (HicA-like mRNA interferase family)